MSGRKERRRGRTEDQIVVLDYKSLRELIIMEVGDTNSKNRDSMSSIHSASTEAIVKTSNSANSSTPKASEVESTSVEQKKYDNLYYIELMVSSGPRKGRDDYHDNIACRELGEDAGGILSLPGMCLFWIADGTSDTKPILNFSSRILAQDIGMCFKTCAYDMFLESRTIDFRKLIKKTFKYLENEWKQRLSEKWESLPTEDKKQQYISLLAPCGDGLLRRSWSSTFLAGIINFNEEKLQCLNIGDAGGLISHKKGEKDDVILPRRGRCFMSIDCYPENEPTVSPNLYEEITDSTYLFSWNNVPGNDSERLIKFLRDNHNIGWAESAEIRKSDDGKTIRIVTDENSAEIVIDDTEETATLKIGDGIIHDLKAKNENGKLNIYDAIIVEFDQVDTFIFVTDGNTLIPLEKFLKTTWPIHLSNIIKGSREKTYDDKFALLGSKLGTER